MNKLTDEQQTLLKFLPDEFEGTKLEKLTMAAFCYCNQSAIERGDQTFTLPYTKLSELTGYGRTMLSNAVHKLCRNNGITSLKTGNYITHTSTEYAVFNVEKVNIESEHNNLLADSEIQKVNIESEHRDVQNSKVNTKYKFKYKYKNNIDNYTETNSTIDDSTDREKERNKNNTLNSTTDMLVFTERLALLSKEIEAMKAENESLRIDIKSLKDDNKTLNERLNKAAKIIKELKEEVNSLHTSTDSTKDEDLNDSEIWNLKREFSDQFNIAKNQNANRSERLMAAKIMNSIADKHPDILTENQRKAARNTLSYLNKNTNVDSKHNTNVPEESETVYEDGVKVVEHMSKADNAYMRFSDGAIQVERAFNNGLLDMNVSGETYQWCRMLIAGINDVEKYIKSGDIDDVKTMNFKAWCNEHANLIELSNERTGTKK